MRSMTGYGHFFYRDERYDIEVEIKSVNSRYLDLKINTDSVISNQDSFIREMITNYIKRGRVNISVYITDKQEQNLELNTVYLKRLADIHQQANELLGLQQDIRVNDLIKHEGVLIRKISKISDESFQVSLTEALNTCLKSYDEMTRQEGNNMKKWLIPSLLRIEEAVSTIERNLPYYRGELKEKLNKAIEELIAPPLCDEIEKRMLAEITFYMDKNDVTEELVRLKSHIHKVNELLTNETEETGRKLNFLFQEMHREIQTVGSKFNTVKVFPHILLIKEEIEKCRELVQNVE